MNVGDLCSRRAVTVSGSAPVLEAAHRMRDEHVGAVIVTEGTGADARVTGILTDRDIVRAQLAHAATLTSVSVGEAMTPDPLVLRAEEPIDGALAHLRARGVRRAPVVSDSGAPLGLISSDDILVHLGGTLMGLAGIVAWQVRKESRQGVAR
jgi:CBS domain-containing protein